MTLQSSPADVLYGATWTQAELPACEHIASGERHIRKTLELQKSMGPVFDITCDCEDGIPVGHELEHMQMVVDMLNSADNVHGRMGVRIHDFSHPAWREEVALLLRGGGHKLAYLTVPKVEHAEEVRQLQAYLEELSLAEVLFRTIPLHLMIESPQAIAQINEIAAVPGVESLDFGILDFISSCHGALSLDACRSPQQFDNPLLAQAKSTIVLAALRFGLVPTHNVCVQLEDVTEVLRDAQRARHEFGFLRMWSIHPSQIEPILQGMRATGDELDHAGRILIQARDKNWGPIRYQGQLHDRASYRYLWSVLTRARAQHIPLPETAQSFFPNH